MKKKRILEFNHSREKCEEEERNWNCNNNNSGHSNWIKMNFGVSAVDHYATALCVCYV